MEGRAHKVGVFRVVVTWKASANKGKRGDVRIDGRRWKDPRGPTASELTRKCCMAHSLEHHNQIC